MLSENLLMSLCIKHAWSFQTLTFPNPSVGAMVVDERGEILALEAHQKCGGPHAEVLALKTAYFKLTKDTRILPLEDSASLHDFLTQNHGGIFSKCNIFVTLEPCSCFGKTPPCAKLLATIKPQKVLIGALESTQNSGGKALLESHHIPTQSGLLEQECLELLLPFSLHHKQGRFTLFKLACRLDGDYKSGVISAQDSRIFTHNQRSVATTLILSGNTLQNDDPLLDARFATPPYDSSHKPDILILTRQRNTLPRTLRIFQNQRNIQITEQIPTLPQGFNIIEGGWGLFHTLREQIDMLALHLSPSLATSPAVSTAPHFQHPQNFQGKLLHTAKLGEDSLSWIQNF